MTETYNMTQTDGDAPERRNAVDIAANFLSWVLVPLLTPVYGLILIFTLSVLSYTVMPSTRVVVTLVILGLNTVLPLILFYVLKVLGFVSDIGLNRRKERALPYVIVTSGYIISVFYLVMHGAPSWVSMFFAGGGLASFVSLAVNFKWKISAHSAGMGGVCAVMVTIAHEMPSAQTLVWLMVWIMLSGLLGASRVWLRRHTLLQVLAGFANGYQCVWLCSMIEY